jgi:hypothetical protein
VEEGHIHIGDDFAVRGHDKSMVTGEGSDDAGLYLL